MINSIKSYTLNKRYSKKVAEIVMKRDKKFEKFIKAHSIDLTSTKCKKILNSNAHELVSMIKNQEVTSQELVITFAN